MNGPNLKVECESCGQRVRASEEWFGTEVECPNCAASLVIPAVVQSTESTKQVYTGLVEKQDDPTRIEQREESSSFLLSIGKFILLPLVFIGILIQGNDFLKGYLGERVLGAPSSASNLSLKEKVNFCREIIARIDGRDADEIEIHDIKIIAEEDSFYQIACKASYWLQGEQIQRIVILVFKLNINGYISREAVHSLVDEWAKPLEQIVLDVSDKNLAYQRANLSWPKEQF